MIYLNGEEVRRGQFPDGTLAMKTPDDWYANEYIIRWWYEGDDELFALICLRRHLADRDPLAHCCLIMDYLPHARLDRVEDSDTVFTLKYFCEIINSLDFMNVYVLDPHSNVSVALLNRVEVKSPERYIGRAIDTSMAQAIFFPDEGSRKRYGTICTDWNLPCATGMKEREWTTGKILGLTLLNAECVKDKDVLIVDDICSRGGTFLHSAKALKAAGAKSVSLYVTHCEETVLNGEMIRSGLIDAIYTTNSLAETTWDIHNSPIPIYIM